MATGFTLPYRDPSITYYTTSTQTGQVISPPSEGFPVSIAGRNYMVDTSFEPYRREAFSHKSIAPQRQSLHFTNIPDDGTVSTDGLWRREARDWGLGSGQSYFDRKNSIDNRFAHSKGINPWTQWSLSLLPDTLQPLSNQTGSGGTSKYSKAIRCGAYVYVVLQGGGTNTVYWQSGSWTSGTYGGPTGITGTFLDMCSDGYNVYILTDTGVWQTTAGSNGAATQIVLGDNNTGGSAGYWLHKNTSYPLDGIIAYVGGRLILAFTNLARWNTAAGTYAEGAAVFDLSSSGFTSGSKLDAGAPEWLYTHPNKRWTWSAIAASSTSIYLSGYSTKDKGATSSVFRTGIEQNAAAGTIPGLTSPVVALPLPPGEYVTAMKGYMNYIFLGTNKGIRMAQANSSTSTGGAGELNAGPLIPDVTEIPSQPVTAITANDRYIYWAWNSFDSTSSGLGRLDLTHFIDTLAPAYASDLMISDNTGTTTWLDWDPITNGPLITFDSAAVRSQVIAGIDNLYGGIWTQDPNNCVSSGYVDSGLITYGIPDNKNAIRIDGNVSNVGTSTSSSASFTLTVDNAAPLDLGSYGGNNEKFSLGFTQQFGEQYTVVTTLSAGTTYTAGIPYKVSPTLNRWTLKALPGIPSGILIVAPILMYDSLDVDGKVVSYDPYAEYTFLENLRQTQQVVTYVEGTWTADVTVDLIHWMPERRRMVQQGGYHGDLIVTLKTLSG